MEEFEAPIWATATVELCELIGIYFTNSRKSSQKKFWSSTVVMVLGYSNTCPHQKLKE